MEPAPNFNQVELRILQVTADGKGHKPEEIMACMDVLADKNNMHQTIFVLRNKLKSIGQDIVAQSHGKRVQYRRFRLLVSECVGT